MNNPLVLIISAVVAILIIIIVVSLLKKSKKEDIDNSSILDVDVVGVPEVSDFSYGYEKEETVVMQPVNQETTEEPKENENTEEKENKEE